MSNWTNKLKDAQEKLQQQLITQEQFEEIKKDIFAELSKADLGSSQDMLSHQTMISHVPPPKKKPRGIKLKGKGPGVILGAKKSPFQIAPAFTDHSSSKQPELIFLDSNGETKINVSYKKSVLLGKSLDHSDLRLALEPFRPEEGYTAEEIQYNKRYTIGMISSLHMEIFQKDKQAYLQDKGSKNGTEINEEVLQRYQPVVLDEPCKIKVGQVLELIAHPLPLGAGIFLTRVNNYPHKQHLILWDKIGLAPSEENILSAFNQGEQKVALAVIDHKFCLLNLKLQNLSYMGHTIQTNQAIPLSRGMSFDIGNTTMIVVE
jgi:hypothetical protein